MYLRNLNLNKILKKKSILLLGPRGTGKSFYLRNQLKNLFIINLLKSSDFLRLSENPSLLEEIVEAHSKKIIAIDEIQKIPMLLDEVHRLIEEKDACFLLTGSSARKLKSHSVNLLAGRAWLSRMHPLNFQELGKDWDIHKIARYGSLPVVYQSENPIEELDSYVQTYIETEIKAEGLIRKLPSFSRFLKTAALSHGELLNFQNIATDSGVPATTIKEHYHILEDTMIGYTLQPWLESKKRKAIQTAKFYFFDLGVLNFLSQTFPEGTESSTWGNRFETILLNEIRCVENYQRRKWDLHFWRSTSQLEVDLLWGPLAIEIKSTKKVSSKHLAGLKALKEEKFFKHHYLVSQDDIERKIDGITIINYKTFLNRIWQGLI